MSAYFRRLSEKAAKEAKEAEEQDAKADELIKERNPRPKLQSSMPRHTGSNPPTSSTTLSPSSSSNASFPPLAPSQQSNALPAGTSQALPMQPNSVPPLHNPTPLTGKPSASHSMEQSMQQQSTVTASTSSTQETPQDQATDSTLAVPNEPSAKAKGKMRQSLPEPTQGEFCPNGSEYNSDESVDIDAGGVNSPSARFYTLQSQKSGRLSDEDNRGIYGQDNATEDIEESLPKLPNLPPAHAPAPVHTTLSPPATSSQTTENECGDDGMEQTTPKPAPAVPRSLFPSQAQESLSHFAFTANPPVMEAIGGLVGFPDVTTPSTSSQSAGTGEDGMDEDTPKLPPAVPGPWTSSSAEYRQPPAQHETTLNHPPAFGTQNISAFPPLTSRYPTRPMGHAGPSLPPVASLFALADARAPAMQSAPPSPPLQPLQLPPQTVRSVSAPQYLNRDEDAMEIDPKPMNFTAPGATSGQSFQGLSYAIQAHYANDPNSSTSTPYSSTSNLGLSNSQAGWSAHSTPYPQTPTELSYDGSLGRTASQGSVSTGGRPAPLQIKCAYAEALHKDPGNFSEHRSNPFPDEVEGETVNPIVPSRRPSDLTMADDEGIDIENALSKSLQTMSTRTTTSTPIIPHQSVVEGPTERSPSPKLGCGIFGNSNLHSTSDLGPARSAGSPPEIGRSDSTTSPTVQPRESQTAGCPLQKPSSPSLADAKPLESGEEAEPVSFGSPPESKPYSLAPMSIPVPLDPFQIKTTSELTLQDSRKPTSVFPIIPPKLNLPSPEASTEIWDSLVEKPVEPSAASSDEQTELQEGDDAPVTIPQLPPIFDLPQDSGNDDQEDEYEYEYEEGEEEEEDEEDEDEDEEEQEQEQETSDDTSSLFVASTYDCLPLFIPGLPLRGHSKRVERSISSMFTGHTSHHSRVKIQQLPALIPPVFHHETTRTMQFTRVPWPLPTPPAPQTKARTFRKALHDIEYQQPEPKPVQLPIPPRRLPPPPPRRWIRSCIPVEELLPQSNLSELDATQMTASFTQILDALILFISWMTLIVLEHGYKATKQVTTSAKRRLAHVADILTPQSINPLDRLEAKLGWGPRSAPQYLEARFLTWVFGKDDSGEERPMIPYWLFVTHFYLTKPAMIVLYKYLVFMFLFMRYFT